MSSNLPKSTFAKANPALFRLCLHFSEINEWAQIFTALSLICESLVEVHGDDDERSLFTGGSSYDSVLTRSYTKINAQAFYSKNIGFQFVPSLKKCLEVVISGMASYYNFYFVESNIVFKIYNFATSFLRYSAKPSLRAEKYLHASANSTTEYCKVMFDK